MLQNILNALGSPPQQLSGPKRAIVLLLRKPSTGQLHLKVCDHFFEHLEMLLCYKGGISFSIKGTSE